MDNENKNKKTQPIDYDDPDAILTSGIFSSPEYLQRREAAVEASRKRAEADQRRREWEERTATKRAETDRKIAAYQRSKNKSIGSNLRTKFANRTPVSSYRAEVIKTRIAATLLTLTAVIAVSVPLVKLTAPEREERIQIEQRVEKSTDYLIAKAYNALAVNDLAGINIDTGKFEIKENTTEAYRRLMVTSNMDVYIYNLILPNDEFDKFIKSVSYNNGLHRYTDMDQFLRINGFCIEGTNTPSLRVFYNMMEDQIRMYSSSYAKDYEETDGFYTPSDYIEEEGYEAKGR